MNPAGGFLLVGDEPRLVAAVRDAAARAGRRVVDTREASVAVVDLRVGGALAAVVRLKDADPDLPILGVGPPDQHGNAPVDDLVSPSALADELDPRLTRLRAAAGDAGLRVHAAVARFGAALGPGHDLGDLLRSARAALLALPGVRGVRLYVEPGPEGHTEELDLVVRGGSGFGVRPADVEAAVGVTDPFPVGGGPVWAFPFTGAVRGALFLDLEEWAERYVLSYLPAARSVSDAYGAARLFGTLKGRTARLERGTLERQRQLSRLTARVGRLSEARDSFLALLSYDLRAPLAVLAGQCVVLAEPDTDIEARRRAVAVVRRQAERMEQMVDDLLSRYRRSTGGGAETEVGDLALVAREMAETFGVVARRRHQQIVLEAPGEAAVEVDLSLVRDVIASLLETALAETPEGARVALRVLVDDDTVSLAVEGGGAPVFDRGDPAHSPGARLVTSLGGTWRSVRGPDGVGRVVVGFPRPPLDRRREQVLVVGADVDQNERLLDALGTWWDTSTTTDVVAALDEMGRSLPGVVVLDASAGGAGEIIDLLENLKADPVLGAVPVVLVAPADGPRLVERAHAAGALAVLVAPVAAETLSTNVRRAMRVARSSRQGHAGRTRDPLTGLETLGLVEARLPGMLAEARAAGRPLPVVVVDVGEVKAINRAHGWLVGDQVLLWVADVLREHSSPGDLLARVGGDVFLGFAVGRPLGVVAEEALRLCRLVEQARPILGVTTVSVRIRSDVIDATELVGHASVDGLLALARGGRETPDGT